MLQSIWAYGNEVYINNMKKTSSLQPLDSRKLDALAQDIDNADCDCIRFTKILLGKRKFLDRGIMCLFQGWEVFEPRFHRDEEVENKWRVTFRVCIIGASKNSQVLIVDVGFPFSWSPNTA